MTWYAAHIIMVAKLKDHAQDKFPVWENIVLISAKSERQAFTKAEKHGRREEGDDDGTFHWGGRPATWVFAGVRKISECAVLADKPDDLTEISCNELELDSQESVDKLITGRPTRVKYNDRYRTLGDAQPQARPKGVRKKRA